MIKFRCKCGQKIGFPDEQSGKICKCPKCNNTCRIPDITRPTGQYQETQNTSQSDDRSMPTPIESYSNRRLWLLYVCVFILFFMGIGYAIYTGNKNAKKAKAFYDMCDALIEKAEILTDQDELEKAIEKYITIKNLISNSKITSSNIDDLLNWTDERIPTLKNKIFANLHLPKLNKIKEEADISFNYEDFDSADKKYNHIVAFIKTNQKQEDVNFRSLYLYSQKHIDISERLKVASTYNVSDLCRNNRANVNRMYGKLIKDLKSLRQSSEVTVKIIAELKDMQAKTNAYYDKVKMQIKIAKREEEKGRQAKEKRRITARKRQLAEDRLRKQEKQAISKVKGVAEILAQKAKEAIKSALKAPSTASFENTTYLTYKKDSDVKEVLIAELDNIHGQYTHYCQLKQKYPDGMLLWFRGKVNSHNSYGAMIQSGWYYVFFYSPSQDYYVSITGDVR